MTEAEIETMVGRAAKDVLRRSTPSVTIELDDLAQEGRIAAYRAIESYRPEHGTKLAGWVEMKARWAMREYVRVQHRRQPPLDELVEQMIPVTRDDTSIADGGTIAAVYASATEKEREVIRLLAQGLIYSEAGRRLGVSKSAVLLRMRRAKRRAGIPYLRDLNRRELQVAALAADGLSNRKIAARLHMGEETVKAHFRSAYQLLGVSGVGSPRTAAVGKLIRQGRI